MHRLSSRSTIVRFRLAASLLCARIVLIPIAAVVLIVAMTLGQHLLALVGCAMALLAMLIALLQWLVAARTGCPLCLTPVLAKKHCVTHRHARTFLGSHRLRVALAVLLKNSFECPYCHESTAMEVREKKRRK